MYRDEQFTFQAARLCGMIVRDEGFTLMRDLALTAGLGRRGLSAERPRRPLRPKELSPPPFGVFLSREGTSGAQTMPRRDWWFGVDNQQGASTQPLFALCIDLCRSKALQSYPLALSPTSRGTSAKRRQKYAKHRHSRIWKVVPATCSVACPTLSSVPSSPTYCGRRLRTTGLPLFDKHILVHIVSGLVC